MDERIECSCERCRHIRDGGQHGPAAPPPRRRPEEIIAAAVAVDTPGPRTADEISTLLTFVEQHCPAYPLRAIVMMPGQTPIMYVGEHVRDLWAISLGTRRLAPPGGHTTVIAWRECAIAAPHAVVVADGRITPWRLIDLTVVDTGLPLPDDIDNVSKIAQAAQARTSGTDRSVPVQTNPRSGA